MPINARRFVRKMRGGAQSHLLEAEDGRWYVVKFRNNPQHRRVLVNEFLGSTVLRYLQVATPETAIINVTQELLDHHPEAYLQLGSSRMPVEPGWHFGSLFPGDPSRLAVYDILPDALLSQVTNRRDFLGALVADKWTGNVDARQSVYFRARLEQWNAKGRSSMKRAGFVAQMIDHGYAFGGPAWEFRDGPLDGLAPRPLVYEGVRGWADFEPWLEQVAGFPEELADKARRSVPVFWLEDDGDELDRLLETLLKRRRRVADLISACRRARPALFPNWR